MTISEEPARSPARNQYRSRISSGTACQGRRWDGGRYGVAGQRRHNAGPTSQTLDQHCGGVGLWYHVCRHPCVYFVQCQRYRSVITLTSNDIGMRTKPGCLQIMQMGARACALLIYRAQLSLQCPVFSRKINHPKEARWGSVVSNWYFLCW